LSRFGCSISLPSKRLFGTPVALGLNEVSAIKSASMPKNS
jgi:hypothetical protein